MQKAAYLVFNQITKAYDSVLANDDISFEVQKGSIHALVGENGAGKSTLMKILFGLETADFGFISLSNKKIDTRKLERKTPERKKIGMVHQHFMLAGPLAAWQHIAVEIDGNPFKPINKTKLLSDLNRLSEKYQLPLDWEEKIENLPVGFQQRLEILKLLYLDADVLIFDEPTAVLTLHEVEKFLQQLLHLKKSGKTIILITHKLKEVKAIADFVTVLRAGRAIESFANSSKSIEDLACLMMGEKTEAYLNRTKAESFVQKEKTVLEIKNFKFRSMRNPLSFKISAGEIVGFAGVEGNGQNQLIEALMQLPTDRKSDTVGQYFFNGHAIKNANTADLRQMGLHTFPEDRWDHGMIAEDSLSENFLISHLDNNQFQSNGILNFSEIGRILNEKIKEFSIKVDQPNPKMGSLSGGNQQKLVAARELFANPRVLIAVHPTRGVDFRSTQVIHEKIQEACRSGMGCLLFSSDLDEILKLSDRIFVMLNHKLVAEFQPAFDERAIAKSMSIEGIQS